MRAVHADGRPGGRLVMALVVDVRLGVEHLDVSIAGPTALGQAHWRRRCEERNRRRRARLTLPFAETAVVECRGH
jgi:hypothetical protein